MSLAVMGLGAALPATRVGQSESAAVAQRVCCATEQQAMLAGVLYRQTGIDGRHVVFEDGLVRDVLAGTRATDSVFQPRAAGAGEDRGPTTGQRMACYRQEALPLALRAARRALDESALPADAVTHLVTVSCTGFAAPGVDIGLIKGLGLLAMVERTHVGFMGCHGALNGLRAAAAYTGADPAARVLLCAVELCSLHYHYAWDPRRMVGNALFVDGAAAVVGVPAAAAPTDAWHLAGSGACLFPDSERAMTWDVGDHGFDMTLSTRVPNKIAANLRPWLDGWLARHGLTVGAVGSWAIHPGGPRVVQAVEDALALPPGAADDSRAVLREYGNMSSPTVLFILDRLRRRGAARPCVALAFGPGLAAEAALFR